MPTNLPIKPDRKLRIGDPNSSILIFLGVTTALAGVAVLYVVVLAAQ
jgi:hypothetical protein